MRPAMEWPTESRNHYILPSREFIAAEIEMMVESSRVDGIVALIQCDKIVPAQFMALARINLPALMAQRDTCHPVISRPTG